MKKRKIRRPARAKAGKPRALRPARSLTRVSLAPGDEAYQREVQAELAQQFRKRGARGDVADALAAQVAEEFRLFQRALAGQTIEVETATEGERRLLQDLTQRFGAICKLVWLGQRYLAEVRKL